MDQVAARRTAVALVGALLGGCVLLGGCALPGGRADRSPTRATGPGTAPSGYRTYRPNQRWEEPPAWRLAVGGVRCGPGADLAPGDTDAENVCLVTVDFTNEGGQPRPFTGTADDPGPAWRISGYDADGREFHGHAREVDATPPGGGGRTDLVFEVPAGLALRRVLIGGGMVDLPG